MAHLPIKSKNYVTGVCYLGGFVKEEDAMMAWMKPMDEEWADGVCQLAQITTRYPQMVYTELTFSLQAEWIYLIHILLGVGPLLAPIKAALRDTFLLMLFREMLGDKLRSLLTHLVKQAGIGVLNPVEADPLLHKVSSQAILVLVDVLPSKADLDLSNHQIKVWNPREDAKEARVEKEEKAVKAMKAANGTHEKHRLKQAQSARSWLICMPNCLNSTVLLV